MTAIEPVVFIVDDDPGVLESSRALTESMGLQSECFSSAVEFLDSYDASKPGCLILDIQLPEMTGMTLLARLREVGHSIPVVMISGHGDIPQAVTALKSGAVDFLVKPYPAAKLRECILDAIEKNRKQRAENAERGELENRISSLTQQEKLVLQALIAGDITKKIASDLDVSLRTVQFRRESIMKKLNVSNRAELVRVASKMLGSTGTAESAESA